MLRGGGTVDGATPETYADVLDRFERDGVRYVVVSGVAVVLHGHVRPVADLDVVIDPAPVEVERALRALASRGFVPSIPLPLSMLTVMRMFDHAQREVDVFVRYHIPFDQLLANSRQVRVGDDVARIVSFEHLLRAKRINGRPHDLSDIAALLALEARGHDRTPT
jgi:acetolactate synthase regulatory subunit